MNPLISLCLLLTVVCFYVWTAGSRSNMEYDLGFLPNEIDCNDLELLNSSTASNAAYWNFQDKFLLYTILKSNNRCGAIKFLFGFASHSLSDEEKGFPLAYGMLVHKNEIQLLTLLSLIYQPQNQFCIAVDGDSSEDFSKLVTLLGDCFDNIHVMMAKPIEWCGHAITEAVFSCLQYLTNLKKDWKYFQYLSGVDAPLKTNLEMVKIFKSLNGSFNAEIFSFPRDRLNKKKIKNSPLPLFKTSLSATFSREAANIITSHKLIAEQLSFLENTTCSDESLWVTAAGNPEFIKIPGGFDAKKYLKKQRAGFYDQTNIIRNSSFFPIDNYYISRYQQWNNRPPAKCKGTFVQYSCVFGVHDLPALVHRHELIAHKMYTEFQPVAFFCLAQKSRTRSIRPLKGFNGSEYANIPEQPTLD